MQTLRIVAFVAFLLFCLTPWASPPIALALGLVLALTLAAATDGSRTSRRHILPTSPERRKRVAVRAFY